MSFEQMRFVGGAMQGQAMWVEQTGTTVNVHIGRQLPGPKPELAQRGLP